MSVSLDITSLVLPTAAPQVYAILNKLYPSEEIALCPSFIFYDNACSLLAHLITNHPESSWLTSTRFIVDAWHYVNHRVRDVLCRYWCNPAPADGEQPDLVITKQEGGRSFTVRAYNSETAEQFNAWISSWEGPLRQMTDYNFDFFIHVLFYLYKEICDAKHTRFGEDEAPPAEPEPEEDGDEDEDSSDESDLN
jgi:hypothetical protein